MATSRSINLIDIKDFKPEVSGKYLVETISAGPLKGINIFTARVIVSKNNAFSIDVSNQIVTHISPQPVL